MFTLKHVLPVSIFFISIFSSGQDIDKIFHKYERLISKAKHDTVRIRLYTEMADDFYEKSDIEKSIKYGEIALDISKKGNYKKAIIYTLDDLIFFNKEAGNYREEINLINEALNYIGDDPNHELYNILRWEKCYAYFLLQEYDTEEKLIKNLLDKTTDKEYQMKYHLLLGDIYFFSDRFKEAIEKYIKVRELADELGDVFVNTQALSNISSIYYEMGNIDEALVYVKECMKIADENNFQQSYAFSNLMKGKCLWAQNKLNEALPPLEIAYKIYENNNNLKQLASVLHCQAIVFYKMKDFLSAKRKFHEALKIEKRIGPTYNAQGIINNLADTYFRINQIDSAFFYLDSSKQIFTSNTTSKQKYHELLTELYVAKNEYEPAYKNFLKAVKIGDSLDSIQHKKETYKLETKYQADKKQQEIVALSANNKVKSLQLYLSLGFATIVLLLLFTLYNRFRVNKKFQKNLEELDKVKSRFFANISHEFRTPLTLTMGSIEKALSNPDENNNDNLQVALRNSKRLNVLIDQLLDLSKIEFDSMLLSVEKTNIQQFISTIYSFFSVKAKEMDIEYVLEINNVCDEGFVDVDKLEKIIMNLLSNAFKFTPKGGKINIKSTVNNKELFLSIKDTGIGIPEKYAEKIFNRFYQVDDFSTRNMGGSGIGLALSKELAEIHKGSLTLISTKNEGSEFVLRIPIHEEAYAKNEFKAEQSKQYNTIEKYKDVVEKEAVTKMVEEEGYKPWVLVVEDNADMQQFIFNIIKDDYSVMLASNGKEALNLAREKVPNVIISDYMMPEMDGIEFCKEIKNNIVTSHIPIIMLTAKANHTTKIEGLESGADIYITKPFDQEELRLQVRNLVLQIQRFSELFKNQKNSTAILTELPLKERKFLDKMYAILQDKFHLENYGVDQLADDLCLSRMQIYRKIKVLTGKSPGEILRNFRIDKAKYLLELSSLSITEIAIKTGYKNQSNFSRIFKEYTGNTPGQYIQLHRKESIE